MSDYETYGDEIICPYCKYEHSDSWELESDDGETECGECGKSFLYCRHIYVTYSASPITEES